MNRLDLDSKLLIFCVFKNYTIAINKKGQSKIL